MNEEVEHSPPPQLTGDTLKKIMWLYRTRTCPLNKRGQCNYAINCFDSHELQPERRAPKQNEYNDWHPSTMKCTSSADESCKYGRACYFAHNDFEVNYHPTMYKTKLCLQFDKDNYCALGMICPNYHYAVEQRKIEKGSLSADAKSDGISRKAPPPQEFRRWLDEQLRKNKNLDASQSQPQPQSLNVNGHNTVNNAPNSSKLVPIINDSSVNNASLDIICNNKVGPRNMNSNNNNNAQNIINDIAASMSDMHHPSNLKLNDLNKNTSENVNEVEIELPISDPMKNNNSLIPIINNISNNGTPLNLSHSLIEDSPSQRFVSSAASSNSPYVEHIDDKWRFNNSNNASRPEHYIPTVPHTSAVNMNMNSSLSPHLTRALSTPSNMGGNTGNIHQNNIPGPQPIMHSHSHHNYGARKHGANPQSQSQSQAQSHSISRSIKSHKSSGSKRSKKSSKSKNKSRSKSSKSKRNKMGKQHGRGHGHGHGHTHGHGHVRTHRHGVAHSHSSHSMHNNMITNPKLTRKKEKIRRKRKENLEKLTLDIISNYKVNRCNNSVSKCRDTYCDLYHNFTDKRRNPFTYNYCGQPCSRIFDNKSRKFTDNCYGCPANEQCEYAHNYLEIWYHPNNFHTKQCPIMKYNKMCKWGFKCTHYHKKTHKRQPQLQLQQLQQQQQQQINQFQSHSQTQLHSHSHSYAHSNKYSPISSVHSMSHSQIPIQQTQSVYAPVPVAVHNTNMNNGPHRPPIRNNIQNKQSPQIHSMHQNNNHNHNQTELSSPYSAASFHSESAHSHSHSLSHSHSHFTHPIQLNNQQQNSNGLMSPHFDSNKSSPHVPNDASYSYNPLMQGIAPSINSWRQKIDKNVGY